VNPNDLAREVVDAAIKVHSALGPGLLESVYEACLAHEIAVRGLRVERQVVLPVRYGDVTVEAGLRLDLLVGEGLVVEIKAVESLQPIHAAQLLTYLRLGGFSLGLLLNFNVVHMKSGIKRLANGVPD
jgi:GxxExxY protein